MATTTREETTTRRRRVLALAAGAAVLGLGATASFAAWTDTEWVFGGTGADAAGLGTSTFEMEQSFDGADWTQNEAQPGESMTFSAGALTLSPGDETFAGVAVRTIDDSIAATNLDLLPAIARVDEAGASEVTGLVDDDDALFDALQVRVAMKSFAAGETDFTCDDSVFADGTYTLSSATPEGLGAATLTGATLAADAASEQFYCFEISLPDTLVPAAGLTVDDYMGRAAAPKWAFASES